MLPITRMSRWSLGSGELFQIGVSQVQVSLVSPLCPFLSPPFAPLYILTLLPRLSGPALPFSCSLCCDVGFFRCHWTVSFKASLVWGLSDDVTCLSR